MPLDEGAGVFGATVPITAGRLSSESARLLSAGAAQAQRAASTIRVQRFASVKKTIPPPDNRQVSVEELIRAVPNVDPHFITSYYMQGMRVYRDVPTQPFGHAITYPRGPVWAQNANPAIQNIAAKMFRGPATIFVGPGAFTQSVLTHELYHVRQFSSPQMDLNRFLTGATILNATIEGGLRGIVSGRGFAEGATQAGQNAAFNLTEFVPSIVGAPYPQWADVGNRLTFGQLPDYLKTPQMMSFLK